MDWILWSLWFEFWTTFCWHLLPHLCCQVCEIILFSYRSSKFIFSESGGKKKAELSFSIKGAFEPIIALGRTLFKKRPYGRRNIILIQLFIHASFWIMMAENNIRYPFMLRQFSGFTGTDWSRLQVFTYVKDIISLLILMPLLTTKFQMHETLFNTFGLGLNCVGFLIAAFAVDLWQFYVAQVSIAITFVVVRRRFISSTMKIVSAVSF